MPRFARHIALFLLLLFCRAMVPDALLLELHPHTHTIDAAHTDTNKAQVGLKHKHCQVENVFGAPFQGSLTALDFTPLVHRTDYACGFSCSWHGVSLFAPSLRGPPLA